MHALRIAALVLPFAFVAGSAHADYDFRSSFSFGGSTTCLYYDVVPNPLSSAQIPSVTVTGLGTVSMKLWGEPCARKRDASVNVTTDGEVLAIFEKTFPSPVSFYSYNLSYAVYSNGVQVSAGATSGSTTIVPATSSVSIPINLARVPLAGTTRININGVDVFNGFLPSGGASTFEFYHSGFDHYFITSAPAEAANIAGGALGTAWSATNNWWRTYTTAVAGTSPVCRFFSATFAPKSSHFYTPYAAECASLKAGNVWGYEEISFYAALPIGSAGTCASGSQPLYRVYNNGKSGAPNHRYTISRYIRDQMVTAGGTAEGSGSDIVFACVPLGHS